jgi:hypothetical protein
MEFSMKARYIAIVIFLGLISWLDASSQTSAPPSPPPGSAPVAKTPAQSVGLYVYPTKQQDSAQQTKDEGECFDSSKQQTGWDPFAPAQPTQTTTTQPAGGGAVAGSAKGAAGGAAIGAIAGDAGEGAAIGATAGAVAGRRKKKKEKKQAQQQAQQTAQTQQQQQLDGFKRSMSACLEARGYTAK